MLMSPTFVYDNGKYPGMGIYGSDSTFSRLVSLILKIEGQFFIASDMGEVEIAVVLDERVKHVRFSFDPAALRVTFSVSSVGQAFLSDELLEIIALDHGFYWEAEWVPDDQYFEEGSLPTTFGLIMGDPEVF